MRKAAALVMLCAMFLAACAGQPTLPENVAVQAEEAGATPPVKMQREDITVAQGGPYSSNQEVGRAFDWLAEHRALPAEYNASELNKALDALPKIHIETPQNGNEKIYLRDNPGRAGFLTSGKLTKDGIKALVDEIQRAKAGQTLQETLAKFGLTYESLQQNSDSALPLFHEIEELPYIAAMQELSRDVLAVTIEPPNLYRNAICHLVFRKEKDAYRFAAMYVPIVESKGYDMVLGEGDQLYFLCRCDTGWGTGAYSNYASILSLQEGAHEILWYQMEGFDCPWGISENLELNLPDIEKMPDGGLHFTMQGKFWYENYYDVNYTGFSDTFQGTCTWHVFDGCDGKGFYTYAKDMTVYFFLSQSEQLKKGLLQRISYMLRAEDEEVCLLAENFLWERNAAVEGYPYKTRSEINDLQSKLEEKAYEPQQVSGQRFYIGNAAPLPTADGALTREAVLSLEQTLKKPGIDIGEAIKASGLIPAGRMICYGTCTQGHKYLPPDMLQVFSQGGKPHGKTRISSAQQHQRF